MVGLISLVLIGCLKFGIMMKITMKLEDKSIWIEKDYFAIFAKTKRERDIFFNAILETVH